MKNRRSIAWIFSFIPLVITFIALPELPEKIPAHYGFSGEVTRYGSKYELLILPIITLLIGFFWMLMGKLALKDEKNGAQNIKVLFWGDIITTSVFTILTIWFINSAFLQSNSINNGVFDFMKALSVCLGVSWTILGNYLPKCKQNYLIGIKTRWTLASETTWYKTHRFGGKVFLAGGIITTILCLFIFDGVFGLWFSLGIFLVMTILVIAYSYRINKQQ